MSTSSVTARFTSVKKWMFFIFLFQFFFLVFYASSIVFVAVRKTKRRKWGEAGIGKTKQKIYITIL